MVAVQHDGHQALPSTHPELDGSVNAYSWWHTMREATEGLQVLMVLLVDAFVLGRLGSLHGREWPTVG